MGSTMRRSDLTVAELLFKEPHRFDFFQAVRLLERISEGRVPVGHDGPTHREIVRFVSFLALEFPASAIHSLEVPGRASEGNAIVLPAPDDRPARMSTPFMGLIGPLGALPTIYTESLIRSPAKSRTSAIDFLDLFHHRLVSLFYRAWEKYNIPTLWEQGLQEKSVKAGSDRFSRRVFDFVGLGLEPLRDRQNFPDASLLYYAGFFAQQHRSAVVLELLVRDYFGHPATVVTFHGQWLRLQPDQQTRMGRKGAHNRLGVDAVAGRKVWDDQSKFRIRLGPLGFDDYREFLPGGRLSASFMDLVRFFVRVELDYDVQMILKAEEVPWCRLSRDPSSAAQLGRYSWLKRREFTRDAENAVFRPPAPPPPRTPSRNGDGKPRTTARIAKGIR